ncbi:hypothetical protein PVAND_003487 [Polypedilum vanderplanki]|uniref:Uncharacterized protein n=1 Tax=Polypedilum vanderplanki TaxID=319348 RepID=A0A9J6BU73_POLVA|nr:hypothetical protein PVAND_003487 [Polypedilum vanderplanki]
MKFLISVFLLCGLVSHSISTLDSPSNTRVEFFRDEIFYRFGRLQAFYDNLNAEMRRLRLAHVDLVSSTFNEMVRVFGEELDFVRFSAALLDESIETRTAELGASNQCLQGINTERNIRSEEISAAVHACARRANQTMQHQLRDVFYPAFADAQEQASTVPLMVMDALSRGNVLGDEQEIIDYLYSQYNFVTQQWPTGVLQIMTWETNRFRVEGDFYVEEMVDCLVPPVFAYMNHAARLVYETEMCQ